jgi:L-alanine-DL-glutamate epimerase-like enolase superfamily enzyme
LASEGLPPKWFTKNPETRFEEDLPEMLDVIEHAAEVATGTSPDSVFAAWRVLYGEQDRWAAAEGYPPLLAHLGTALVERAMIDAFCRAASLTFAQAVRENALGIDLGSIHPELAGTLPSDWLPEPTDSVIARHTVGLGDPLRARDIPATERIEDGLPHALADAAREYGLTHFKIKVCGNLAIDVSRLKEVAAVLREVSPGFRFTLDGNEQYRDLEAFRAHWEAYLREDDLRAMLTGGGLLFVEQPSTAISR